MPFTLLQGYEGPVGEQSHTSTLSLTSALDGGGWSTPRPGRFDPWKEFDPRTLQSVANRYSGQAIPTHECVRS